MKSLIKWPGGKSSEIRFIQKIIPDFDRYIEPFLGGGALFFYLEPKKAIINDASTKLMMFYSFLKNGSRRRLVEKELHDYVKYWARITTYIKKFGDSLVSLYEEYRFDRITEEEFQSQIQRLFKEKIVPFNGLFLESFCHNQKSLLKHIENNLIAKLRRIKHKIDLANGFSKEMLMQNIETAFRSGFYIHFREIMNKSKRGEIQITDAKEVANYYFVREFCYGSMFRYNSKGDFNIPYGGIAYNTKDFKTKVTNLFSNSVRRLLENAIIENMDFEKLLLKHKPTHEDFIFFDPPYDTEFSEYEENPFTKEDQKRLAECIMRLPSKFILIIKETPFIRSLYETPEFSKRGVKIEKVGKKYTYNVRGRNERVTTHLIIHNIVEVDATNLNMFF
ncbi:MAG: DNA adenine methylase [Planctomycetota bacterium]|nr:MAG: DNA adenine methylase [Planctomycetota bacterium]